MLPLGLIYAVGELLTLRSVQKAGEKNATTVVMFGMLRDDELIIGGSFIGGTMYIYMDVKGC